MDRCACFFNTTTAIILVLPHQFHHICGSPPLPQSSIAGSWADLPARHKGCVRSLCFELSKVSHLVDFESDRNANT